MIESKETVAQAMQRQAEKSAKFLRQDRLFAGVTFSFAALVLLTLFGILVSLVISLTTTPMMCAALLKHPAPAHAAPRTGWWAAGPGR